MNKSTIFDELNLDIDPYKTLKIESTSSNQTIKEAYKAALKGGVAPEQKAIVEKAFSMIKNDILRSRYDILKNRPYESLDEIKGIGIKPVKMDTGRWIEYIQ